MKISGKTSLEIVESIRTLLINGDLQPGVQLPPLRELAQNLEVNRNTVASAYKRLVTLGLASTHRRNGTILNETAKAGEQEGFKANFGINLGSGNPNPEFLPNPFLYMNNYEFRPYLYGEESILPVFKEWITQDFKKDCPANNDITLTYGSVDAIERIVSVHLVPGDCVAVEDPCYLGSINAIRLAGMITVGIEIDEFGMIPAYLKLILSKGVKAVLVTPRAHNPTGCSFSHQRALEIRRILVDYPEVLVIVDDHYALLASTKYYSIIPDSTHTWTLIRSVSKALGPDMRLAYIAADSNTISKINARLAPGTTWVSHLIQEMVIRCIASPEYNKTLNVARKQYKYFREYLCELLAEQDIYCTTNYDGFNVWISFPETISERLISQKLANHGWLVRSGYTFEIDTKVNAIRVTISEINKAIAEDFVKVLKLCIDDIQRSEV